MPEIDPSRLFYVVVDEMVGDVLGLSASPWPRETGDGRLRFDEESFEIVADRARFHRLLTSRRRQYGPARALPDQEALATRPVRIGDTLAVETDPSALEAALRADDPAAPEAWMAGQVWDITADAREAAKAAYFFAVTPPLSRDIAEELVEIEDDETAPGDPGPKPPE